MAKKKQVEVIEGEKISPEEAKKLDPAKRGTTISGMPAEGDVSGQWHNAVVICPCCYTYRYIVESDYQILWYTCSRCGCQYRA